MRAFFARALSELEAGRRVYLCFVAANRKGSPGTPAAHMLLTLDGDQVGTIGGGIMEQRVLEDASWYLKSDWVLLPQLQELKHQKSVEEASGLICGGGQTNIFWIYEPCEQHIGQLERMIEVYDADASAYLQVRPSGCQVHVGESAPRMKRHLEQGDATWNFELPLFNPRRIVIFGGGHCGRALAELMNRLAYCVTVVEPRGELFTLEGLSGRVNVISQKFERAADLIAHPEFCHVVVMTYSLPTDVEALSGILRHPFLSVGVMGSRAKISRMKTQLESLGFDKNEIESVRAPIGLDFDSDTPDEIAVSIAAQILLERKDS